MFYRNRRGSRKFAQQVESSVGVVDIVIRQFFSVQLFGLGETSFYGHTFFIEYGVLMRIFSVAQILRFFVSEGNLFGKTNAQFFAHIRRDERIVNSRMLKYLVHKTEFGFKRHSAPFYFVKHPFIVRAVDDNGYVLIVFCGASEHRRPSDIDIFDGFLQIYAFFHYSLFEGIKIDAHKVDGIYSEFFEFGHMFFIGTHRKNTRVNFRMQSFYPPVEAFGKPGNAFHRDYFYARAFKSFIRSSGRDNFVTFFFETFCKVDDARFVRYADKCTFFHKISFYLKKFVVIIKFVTPIFPSVSNFTAFGNILCSSSSTLFCNVSGVSFS